MSICSHSLVYDPMQLVLTHIRSIYLILLIIINQACKQKAVLLGFSAPSSPKTLVVPHFLGAHTLWVLMWCILRYFGELASITIVLTWTGTSPVPSQWYRYHALHRYRHFWGQNSRFWTFWGRFVVVCGTKTNFGAPKLSGTGTFGAFFAVPVPFVKFCLQAWTS